MLSKRQMNQRNLKGKKQKITTWHRIKLLKGLFYMEIIMMNYIKNYNLLVDKIWNHMAVTHLYSQ